MEKQLSTSDTRGSSLLARRPQHTQFRPSPTPEKSNGNVALTSWECKTCGRRYVGPASVGLFISPPPTTECVMVNADESWAHANGGFVSLSITGGATCDYVRINHTTGRTEFSEPVDEPVSITSPLHSLIPGKFSVRAHDQVPLKMVGEHGRVSRKQTAADAAYIEDDNEDCEFWKAKCEDIGCICVGEHQRYQCAIAEMDEEPIPKVKATAIKCGFRFPRATSNLVVSGA